MRIVREEVAQPVPSHQQLEDRMNIAQAKAGKVDKVWWLARATKYTSNHGGDFSPTTPVSEHAFGWDKRGSCFVLENTFSVAVPPGRQTMPMPVELAEMFLLRCREEDFHKRMLAAACNPPELVWENMVHGTFALEVKRTRNTSDATRIASPNLLLTVRSAQQPVVGFALFSGLRERLGKLVTAVSEEVIREHLRT